MRFKVGDVVICTNVEGDVDIDDVGLVGIVIRVNKAAYFPFRVRTVNGLDRIMQESELELLSVYNSPLYQALR